MNGTRRNKKTGICEPIKRKSPHTNNQNLGEESEGEGNIGKEENVREESEGEGNLGEEESEREESVEEEESVGEKSVEEKSV